MKTISIVSIISFYLILFGMLFAVIPSHRMMMAVVSMIIAFVLAIMAAMASTAVVQGGTSGTEKKTTGE